MKVGVIAVSVWLLVFGYFGWWGATHPVWEGDSLAYHIPIARMINIGRWLDKSAFTKPWFYYPAVGETLLAGWTALRLPANWFNLLGWAVLTGVVYGLGRRMGLKKEMAVLAAVTVAMWPSVVRLIPTQTVDIWVVVWWVGAVKKIIDRDWVWAGVFLGMLVGTKYSGLLFALILIAVFWKKLRSNILIWLVPMILIGGFWYARNWILIGNPVYPMDVPWLGWKGLPDLVLFTGKPIATLLNTPMLVVGALISEYLVWAGLLLLPIVLRNKWVLLGWLNFGVYLFLPSRPENIISDLRYIYPAMIPLLISVWRWFVDSKKEEILILVAFMGMAAEMTQLDYHPKLFVIIIIGVMLFMQFSTPLRFPPKLGRKEKGSIN